MQCLRWATVFEFSVVFCVIVELGCSPVAGFVDEDLCVGYIYSTYEKSVSLPVPLYLSKEAVRYYPLSLMWSFRCRNYTAVPLPCVIWNVIDVMSLRWVNWCAS